MDDADEAQVKEHGIAARRIAAARQKVQGQGTSHCIDCGDDIPPARRKALPAARRCVGCQEISEMDARGR